MRHNYPSYNHVKNHSSEAFSVQDSLFSDLYNLTVFYKKTIVQFVIAEINAYHIPLDTLYTAKIHEGFTFLPSTFVERVVSGFMVVVTTHWKESIKDTTQHSKTWHGKIQHRKTPHCKTQHGKILTQNATHNEAHQPYLDALICNICKFFYKQSRYIYHYLCRTLPCLEDQRM
jgi:hypothetical protein